MSSPLSPLTSDVQQDNSDFSLLDLATLLAENLRLLITVPLLCGLLAFGISYLITPSFTAAAQIMVPQQQSGASALLSSLGGLSSLAGGTIPGLKNPADQWVGMLKSRTVADAIIDRFNLRARYELDYYFEARKFLENKARFVAGKDGLIGIEVDDRDPKVAADMANAYIDELSKLSDTLAVGEAGQRRQFYEQQLKSIKDQLITAETALKESGINTSVIKTSPDAAVTALSQLQAQIAAAEVRLQVQRGRLTERAPEYQDALRELNSLRRQLTQAEQKDPSGSRNNGAEYVARFREFKYYETLFEIISRQYEIARADEAREGVVIQVVDHAKVPEWKSKPKRALMGIGGTLFSLFALIMYLIGRDNVQKMNSDPVQAEKWQRFRRSLPFSGHR